MKRWWHGLKSLNKLLNANLQLALTISRKKQKKLNQTGKFKTFADNSVFNRGLKEGYFIYIVLINKQVSICMKMDNTKTCKKRLSKKGASIKSE